MYTLFSRIISRVLFTRFILRDRQRQGHGTRKGSEERAKGTGRERGGRDGMKEIAFQMPTQDASPILISADDSLIKMLVAFLLQVRIEEAFSVERGGSARIAHLIGESTDGEKAGNEKFEIKATPFRTRVRSLAFARQMTLLITDSSITFRRVDLDVHPA